MCLRCIWRRLRGLPLNRKDHHPFWEWSLEEQGLTDTLTLYWASPTKEAKREKTVKGVLEVLERHIHG